MLTVHAKAQEGTIGTSSTQWLVAALRVYDCILPAKKQNYKKVKCGAHGSLQLGIRPSPHWEAERSPPPASHFTEKRSEKLRCGYQFKGKKLRQAGLATSLPSLPLHSY